MVAPPIGLRLVTPVPDMGPLISRRLLEGIQPLVAAWRQPVIAPLLSSLAGLSLKFAEKLENAVPSNWDGIDLLDYLSAMDVMNEGIPLVWVPRSAVVAQLVAAADYQSRAQILAGARLDIAADCEAALVVFTETISGTAAK